MTETLYETDDPSILSIKKWESDQHIIAGMTTRHGGTSQSPYQSLNVGFHVKDRLSDVLNNRHIVAKKLSIPLQQWVVGTQPHGNNIYKVKRGDRGKGATTEHTAIREVDGLYTTERGILLVSLYADCVPIYFIEKQRQMVGIAHAGWRGTVANIAGKMVEAWRKEGIDPTKIQVVIGPSIGPCCYEVNDVVMSEVNKFQFDKNVAQKNKSNQYMLNLKLLNKLLLIQAGIPEKDIYLSPLCTSCLHSTFFSHRKENGQTGRMMAYIGLR
ncbi:peptidoglycan editing factor PgeF [Pueribacillus sp. YX66]|uniref:peptidoglycan editing factor PgeF n=1 Tax=Pueribacillus sp. YX66 TaxID=3229242 RepID=UPI00358D550E